MRSENIAMTLTIPVAYDKPDKNGNIYTREAIENAIKNFKPDMPLEDESGKCIGHVNSARLYEDNMVVTANVFGGGTRCIIKDMEVVDGVIVIKDFEIISIGFGE